MGRVIKLSSREARLKRRVRQHLHGLGFLKDENGRLVPPSLDKDSYRKFHEVQRAEKLSSNADWLRVKGPALMRHFAAGDEVSPAHIEPILELVAQQTWQSDLFRLASLYWRVPVSDGYGRRMRFLVWDKANSKLIGLIALGDAVFNQKARDDFVGWDHHQRSASLVNLMDAYVLGAVPPYNMLLGGKLIASLVRTRDIVKAFEERYRKSVGIISGIEKNARLAAVTTSSALGRSSVYNRLKLSGETILKPIGFTSGWGHFHFSGAIFDELRQYLFDSEDEYAHGYEFGSGPNWKIRVIRKALDRLGLDSGLAQHGFQREVFFCSMAENALPFLKGKVKRIRYTNLRSVAEIGDAAKARWMMPRAERDSGFRLWTPDQMTSAISPAEAPRTGKRRNVVGA